MPCHTSTAGVEPTITQVEHHCKRRNGIIPFLLRADELIERSKEVAVRKKDSISAAVEAGREAYLRESKS